MSLILLYGNHRPGHDDDGGDGGDGEIKHYFYLHPDWTAPKRKKKKKIKEIVVTGPESPVLALSIPETKELRKLLQDFDKTGAKDTQNLQLLRDNLAQISWLDELRKQQLLKNEIFRRILALILQKEDDELDTLLMLLL